MIKEFFPEAEANKILSIPLSRHDSIDRLFWPFSNTGMYTVKSGYMFFCQIIAQQKASSSGINNKNGFLKVKYDAAVKANFGVGIGIVILNENNNVLACRYKCLRASMVVELAQGIVVSVREGLLFAKEIRTNAKLILETDCQALHSKLISAASNLFYVGSIVDDIRRMAGDLDGVDYRWTRRDENLIADQLAKYARDNLVLNCYSGPLPEFVKLPSS